MGDQIALISDIVAKEQSILRRNKQLARGIERVQARLKISELHLIKSVEERNQYINFLYQKYPKWNVKIPMIEISQLHHRSHDLPASAGFRSSDFLNRLVASGALQGNMSSSYVAKSGTEQVGDSSSLSTMKEELNSIRQKLDNLVTILGANPNVLTNFETSNAIRTSTVRNDDRPFVREQKVRFDDEAGVNFISHQNVNIPTNSQIQETSVSNLESLKPNNMNNVNRPNQEIVSENSTKNLPNNQGGSSQKSLADSSGMMPQKQSVPQPGKSTQSDNKVESPLPIKLVEASPSESDSDDDDSFDSSKLNAKQTASPPAAKPRFNFGQQPTKEIDKPKETATRPPEPSMTEKGSATNYDMFSVKPKPTNDKETMKKNHKGKTEVTKKDTKKQSSSYASMLNVIRRQSNDDLDFDDDDEVDKYLKKRDSTSFSDDEESLEKQMIQPVKPKPASPVASKASKRPEPIPNQKPVLKSDRRRSSTSFSDSVESEGDIKADMRSTNDKIVVKAEAYPSPTPATPKPEPPKPKLITAPAPKTIAVAAPKVIQSKAPTTVVVGAKSASTVKSSQQPSRAEPEAKKPASGDGDDFLAKLFPDKFSDKPAPVKAVNSPATFNAQASSESDSDFFS